MARSSTCPPLQPPLAPSPTIPAWLANAEILFTWVEHVVERVTTCLALALDVALSATSDRPLHHRTFSDRVDTVLLNPWAGIPVFLAVVWLLFELTTKFAAPFQAFIGNRTAKKVTLLL